MRSVPLRSPWFRFALAVLLVFVATPGVRPVAQSRSQPAKQKLDEEYTAKIKEYTQDPRISTELVDHLPASDTIPTPLKFFGRMPGTPGELTYAKDIQRYYEALDKASDRISMWTIGKTEEGRDMVLLAVADEATIKQLDKYKGMLASLTDPRKTTEEQAQQLIRSAKPIYWVTSGMHSGRDRWSGNAARTALPAGRRGDALHPGDSQQRHHAHHAGHRSRRPREARRHLLLQQETSCRRGAAAADVLGQVRRARQQPRRHGPVPRADEEHDQDVPRLEADHPPRLARSVRLSLRLDWDRAL